MKQATEVTANRSRLEKRHYHLKTEDSKICYKKQKNYCSQLYKKERKRFSENLDQKNITDNKKFWKTIKPFFSDKVSGSVGITLVENEAIISVDQIVAETFNNFFANGVKSLNINIPSHNITASPASSDDPIDGIILKYSNHPSNVENCNFSFNPMNLNDMKAELKALNTQKASNSSSIPRKLLKENSDICAVPLTSIINAGIMNGKFEDSLKKAELLPLHKQEDATDKKNYRNISLLPIVSKMFEKFIQKQIGFFTDTFLSPFLCGYRKGYNP